MKDEVLAESAPLHGRSSLELKLRPFNYLETADFLQEYSSEEKAICYGLSNGVAKYIEQFDTCLSLEDNIIEQFYSIGGYFSEEQVKTVVTSDRKNPALYNSIVSAVATGHTKNGEIASYVGADDVTYPLKILVNAEILERRISKKPYYILNDSMLEFWFRYVNRATILDENKKQKQIEIDLLGKTGKDTLLVGECKFKNSQFGKVEFEKMMDKIKYIPVTNPFICVFSLGGFSDYVKERAGQIRLIEIDDMYRK